MNSNRAMMASTPTMTRMTVTTLPPSLMTSASMGFIVVLDEHVGGGTVEQAAVGAIDLGSGGGLQLFVQLGTGRLLGADDAGAVLVGDLILTTGRVVVHQPLAELVVTGRP